MVPPLAPVGAPRGGQKTWDSSPWNKCSRAQLGKQDPLIACDEIWKDGFWGQHVY